MTTLWSEAKVELPHEELEVKDQLTKQREEPMEDLVPIVMTKSNSKKVVQVGSCLNKEDRQHLVAFCCMNMDDFAWTIVDILGIASKVIAYF